MATTVTSDLFSEIRDLDEEILQKIDSIESAPEEISIVICEISILHPFGRLMRKEYGLYILAKENDGRKMHAMRLGREHHNVNIALAAIKLTLLAATLEEPRVYEFTFHSYGAPL